MTSPDLRSSAAPAGTAARTRPIPLAGRVPARPVLLARPGPVSGDWEWQLSASCRGKDVEVFFHPTGERGPARASRAAAAKALCAACPVLQQCRDHALATAEPYGVWGGMTEEERLAEVKARRAS